MGCSRDIGWSDAEESNGDDEAELDVFIVSVFASFNVNRLDAMLERRLMWMNVDSGLVLSSVECWNFER